MLTGCSAARDCTSRSPSSGTPTTPNSFERIPWDRLAQAAIITTVSRYMKHLMWREGVDPLVIANGLDPEVFVPPERDAVAAFREQARGRTVLSKVARWATGPEAGLR